MTTKCQYATVRANCMCDACMARYDTAKRLVARGADLRDLVDEIRPFVLKVR